MTAKVADIQSAYWRIADAAAPMERVTQMRLSQHASGKCQSPVHIETLARPRAPDGCRDVVIGPGKAHSVLIETEARCRRCKKCLQARGALWTSRALREWKGSVRTWLCTLTLSPEQQYKFLETARSRLGEQGIDYDALDFGDQFRTRVGCIGPELQKFLKRLRKHLGEADALRFLLVAEHHKSGDPHFHALIHEQSPTAPLRKAVLEEQWRLGFGHYRLTKDAAQAVYVCKYLTKSLAARVRASVAYGDQPQEALRHSPLGGRDTTTPQGNATA